jgi:acetyltransferase
MVDLPKEREIAIAGGERLLVRPVRRQDETALAEMLGRASPEDIRFRCFGAVKDFPHVLASRLVGIDPKQEATLVALAEDTGELMGVVHIICERLHPNIAEYDIMVRSDHQGHGLGYRLMQEILSEARRRGLAAVEGYILRDNRTMLAMARELGFKNIATQGDVVLMRAQLAPATAIEVRAKDAPYAPGDASRVT